MADLEHKGIKILDLNARKANPSGGMRWQVELKGKKLLFPTPTEAKAAIDRVLAQSAK